MCTTPAGRWLCREAKRRPNSADMANTDFRRASTVISAAPGVNPDTGFHVSCLRLGMCLSHFHEALHIAR